MTILSKNNEQGRSMVEMLGVLAIIGVLSVGGISGYSKAMAKFKLTKAQDQISMLLMNIRTAFATSPNYSGLDVSTAISYNIAPGDMAPTGASDIKHAFGGHAYVGACSDGKNACTGTPAGNNQYFYIQLDNLGNEACMSLASSDWGTDGLVYMNGMHYTSQKSAFAKVEGGTKTDAEGLPLSITKLGDGTGGKKYCKKGEYSSLIWVYY